MTDVRVADQNIPVVRSDPGSWNHVSGALLHRSDSADAFPTAWRKSAENQFTVLAHWPRPHRFFATPGCGPQDPMLIAETTRQPTGS